jgi:acetylornithine/N-succinyldiaminopimelate aminotransferase
MRGRGLLQALALGKPIAAEVAANAFEAGLLLNAPQPDSLRFMPSLTLAQGEIEQMVAILDEIFHNMNGGT